MKKIYIKNIYYRLPKYFFYSTSDLNNIALFGIRRGGTTWISDLICSKWNIRYLDQPTDAAYNRFANNYLQSKKRIYLPPRKYYSYFNLTKDEEIILKRYFRLLIGGKLPYYDKYPFFYKNRIFLKLTNSASYIHEWLINEFSFYPIVLFRHPVLQALSTMRAKWKIIYPVYYDSLEFRRKYLSNDQINLIQEIDKSDNILNKYIIDWVFNFIPFYKSKINLNKYYNTPQKLDRGIRLMLACHIKKETEYGKEYSEES
jgi:hypothetical protein